MVPAEGGNGRGSAGDGRHDRRDAPERPRGFPDNSCEPAYKHESGDTAIDEGYFVGTNTAPLSLPTGESAPATGKAVRVRICDIATVQNGVITNHRFYFDQVDLFCQLGLLPETPS
ncbi:MAG TPA: ester cyclase [Actinomycetota bacterium]|nr:ester cyclase [Actinomycetota bacterium]